MKQLVTIGETMVSFFPQMNEAIQFGATLKMRIAGAESNTAAGICKLGHPASFITRLGDDPFGHFILRMVRADGINADHVTFDSAHRTGLMFKESLPNHETAVHYYRQDSAASHLTPLDIPEQVVSDSSILHVTGITPVLSDSCREAVFCAIETAKSNHCAVSFDPNIRMKLWKNNDYSPLMRELVQKSDYLLIGLDEAETLYGSRDISHIVSSVFSAADIKLLAVKNGKDGAWVCDSDKLLLIPPVTCNCIDPVGAGDAFNAGFLSGILDDKTLEECGTAAAVLGAKATETAGDIEGLLTSLELQNFLNHISAVQR